MALPPRVALCLGGLVLALCLWMPVEAARIAPYYLAYFNELVGGPANGYKYLGAGDLDWGQDVKGLAEYLRSHGIRRITLDLWSPADPRMFGIAYEQLWPGRPVTGYVAVSTVLLQVVFGYPRCADSFRWLDAYQPVAKIGYTIFVYHVPESQPLPPPTPVPDRCLDDLHGEAHLAAPRPA